MRRAIAIAALILIEEAIVIALIRTGRDLDIKAKAQTLIRRAYSAADDKFRILP